MTPQDITPEWLDEHERKALAMLGSKHTNCPGICKRCCAIIEFDKANNPRAVLAMIAALREARREMDTLRETLQQYRKELLEQGMFDASCGVAGCIHRLDHQQRQRYTS